MARTNRGGVINPYGLRLYSRIREAVSAVLFKTGMLAKKNDSPYAGYKVCFGSKSLSEIRNAGFIPLTAKYVISGKTYQENTLTMTVNGAETPCAVKCATNSNANPWSMTVFVDIEGFYSGDLTKCAAVTSLSHNKTYPDIYSHSFSTAITKWLEPEG